MLFKLYTLNIKEFKITTLFKKIIYTPIAIMIRLIKTLKKGNCNLK